MKLSSTLTTLLKTSAIWNAYTSCLHRRIEFSFRLSYLFDRFFLQTHWKKIPANTTICLVRPIWRQCRCLIFLQAMIFESAFIFCLGKSILLHIYDQFWGIWTTFTWDWNSVCIHEDCISFITQQYTFWWNCSMSERNCRATIILVLRMKANVFRK